MEVRKDWYRLPRGDKVDDLEAARVLKKATKIRDCKIGRRNFSMSSIWDKLKKEWAKLSLAPEWRFEEGNRKSDSCSTESEYKNKRK